MNILLDTHIVIWALTNSSRLSEKARGLIADEQNQLFVSSVSIWEIGVKHALGRGNAPTFGVTAAIAGANVQASASST